MQHDTYLVLVCAGFAFVLNEVGVIKDYLCSVLISVHSVGFEVR